MPAWSAACGVREINRLEELSQAGMPYPARLTGKFLARKRERKKKTARQEKCARSAVI